MKSRLFVSAFAAALLMMPVAAQANQGGTTTASESGAHGNYFTRSVDFVTWPVRTPFRNASYPAWRQGRHIDPSAPEAAPHMDFWWDSHRDTVQMQRDTYPPMRLKNINNPNMGKDGTLAYWSKGR